MAFDVVLEIFGGLLLGFGTRRTTAWRIGQVVSAW
jgi:hypothetical protein